MRLLAALICMLMLGACTPQIPKPRASARGASTTILPTLDQLKSQADKLLAQMASEDYNERKEATEKLDRFFKESGARIRPLLEYVKTRLAELSDPELKHRLKAIVGPGLVPWKYFKVLRTLGDGTDDTITVVFDDGEDGEEDEGCVITCAPATCFSPDGRLLASGHANGKVRIWNPATGKCLHQLLGHKGFIHSLAFSPDGKLLVSSGNDSKITIWDTQTWKSQRVLQEQKGTVYAVCFSPDGKLLASGAGDSTVKIWGVQTGRCVHTLDKHFSEVYALAFSPDGKFLASSGLDREILIWDVKTGECSHILVDREQAICSLAFSPDGCLLTATGVGEEIRIWDWRGGNLSTLEGHETSPNSTTFSEDGRFFLSCAWGEIVIWDFLDKKILRRIEPNIDDIYEIRLAPENRYFAAPNAKGTVVIWGIPEDEEVGKSK